MFKLSQTRTKRLFAIHGWSGTVLGLLLYAVVLTGAIAVFAHEIGAWSKGGAPQPDGISTLVHRHVERLADQVDPIYHEEVRVVNDSSGTLRISFTTQRPYAENGLPQPQGHYFFVSRETGEVVEERYGFISEVFSTDRGEALEDFLVDLHVRLSVPEPWGLLLTGILGMSMLVASVSGLIMHRHLIRDLFTAPRGKGMLSDKRDTHILAAVWGLPFSILLAFTGAFFSFAISLGLPLVAMVAFGGDQQALAESVIGLEAPVDPTPTPLASLDYIVVDSTARSGNPPSSLSISHFGTASAEVTAFHRAADGSLTGDSNIFNGVTRAFEGERPLFGQVPSAGAAALSLMGPLHFGSFAGLASKTVWLAMGLAMSYVIATGMLLWVNRRAEAPLWRHFARAVRITVWGLPLALLGSAVAFFITLPAGDPLWWTPAGFLIASAIAIWMGLGERDPTPRYRVAGAILCLGLPLLRHITGGTSWSEAILIGNAEVLTIDLLLLFAGAWLWLGDARPRVRNTVRVLEPAE
ncbi:MAG: PepSY-associated TM helix domain-containing protein [Pseudomonadota bacterium]